MHPTPRLAWFPWQAPKHVIFTTEFDCYRWPTDQYAVKLHEAGALADYVVWPGLEHSAYWSPLDDRTRPWRKALRIYG